MILQLTKKLSDKLKIKLEDIDTLKEDELYCYHCNLLKFGRDYGVLLTNNKTLFSYFVYSLSSSDFKNFESVVSQEVFKILLELKFTQEELEKVLRSLDSIRYTKTSNRSVTASMNDMAKMIENCLYMDDNLLEINKKINEIPYKRNSYAQAKELFDELLS